MTYIVHVEFSDHVQDFEIKDNPARTHEDAAESLCRLVGGQSWEVR